MKDEVVILFFRKHWVVLWKYFFFIALVGILYILALIVFLVFELPLSTLYTSTLLRSIMIGLLVFTIYTGIYSFIGLINYFLDVVIITNYRIVEIKKTVFITNRVMTLGLDDIQDIHGIKLGLMENLLGYGSLTVTSSTSNFIKKLKLIPTPHYYSDIITKVKHEKAILMRQHFPSRASENDLLSENNKETIGIEN